jgi:hypothetical protein
MVATAREADTTGYDRIKHELLAESPSRYASGIGRTSLQS